MTRKKRTVEERQKVLPHVEYEVNMLVTVANALASGLVAGSLLANAMVESFVLHTRNLIDFLWPEGSKSDHVLADDYFLDPEYWKQERPNLSPLLDKSRIRAHKEIAHLSYDRLLLTEDSRKWPFVEITKDIVQAYQVFLELLPPEYRATGKGNNP